MAKRINRGKCIVCGICLPECPNEGISEIDGLYVIDPNLCTECAGVHASARCEAVCPVDAVEDDPDHQEDADTLFARAVDLHPESFPRD